MRLIIALCLLAVSFHSTAQWVYNGGTGPDIYYTGGAVSIGTNAPKPNASFTVSGLSFLSGKVIVNTNVSDVIASFTNTSTTGTGLFLQAGGTGKHVFHFLNQAGATVMYGLADGSVGIGTTDPKGYKLAVKGKAIAEEVVVKIHSNWPDYVFEPQYKLMSLSQLEKFIIQYKHLPEVPSEAEVSEKGIAVGEMNAILLKKVEELTLYVIELQKQIDQLKQK